ncbi:hypothetical protein HMPREF2826_05720 [Olsenella sp. HMSC062G07]|nr:hypothetical protein HMPREF2826_05720 [Olsenella sp. HMSC062G07]
MQRNAFLQRGAFLPRDAFLQRGAFLRRDVRWIGTDLRSIRDWFGAQSRKDHALRLRHPRALLP